MKASCGDAYVPLGGNAACHDLAVSFLDFQSVCYSCGFPMAIKKMKMNTEKSKNNYCH